MNKLIVGALVALVLLIFFTVLLTSFSQKNQSQNAAPTPIPTAFLNQRAGTTSGSNPVREPGPEVMEKANNLIPTDQIDEVSAFSKKLPFSSDAFDMAYSDGTGEYFYRLKTSDGEQKLNEFLQQNGVSDFKNNSSDLFKKTDKPVGAALQKAEDDLFDARIQQSEAPSEEPPDSIEPLRKDEQQFVDVTKTLMNFQLNLQTTGGTTGPGLIANPNALDQIFNEAGSKVGTPPKMLKAIMSIECGRLLGTPDRDILAWSTPGKGLPSGHGCRQNQGGYGAYGPMQFVPGTFKRYGSAINRYGGYTHAPNIQNIKDSVYAAAELMLLNSGATGPNWTFAQIRRAYGCYAGGCAAYDKGRLGRDFEKLFATFIQRYNSY